MPDSVCPWWLGHRLAHPLRRVWQVPLKVLPPFVTEGMTVLEPNRRALVAEPSGHVEDAAFAVTLDMARAASLAVEPGPAIRMRRAAALRRA